MHSLSTLWMRRLRPASSSCCRRRKCGRDGGVLSSSSTTFSSLRFYASGASSSTSSSTSGGDEVALIKDKDGKLRVFISEIGGMAPQFFTYLCENVSTYVREVLRLEVMSASRGKLTASSKFTPNFIGNPDPAVIHGGVTASIIDHIGGFCAWTVLPRTGLMLSTVDLRIEYIAPLSFKGGNEVVVCEANVVHATEKLIITDIICWNKDKTLKFAAGRDGYFGKYLMKYVAKLFMKRHKVSFSSKNRLDSSSNSNSNSSKNSNSDSNSDSNSSNTRSWINPSKTNFLQTPPNDIVFWNKTAKEYAEFVENYTPFGKEVLGMKVQKVAKGELSCIMPYKKYFLGNFRQPCLHGGVPASIVDQCGGFCARSILEDSSMHVSTVDMTIDYLAPLPCFEGIVCEAKVVGRSEKNVIITDVTCWNESRTKLLVHARCIFNIYIPKKYSSPISSSHSRTSSSTIPTSSVVNVASQQSRRSYYTQDGKKLPREMEVMMNSDDGFESFKDQMRRASENNTGKILQSTLAAASEESYFANTRVLSVKIDRSCGSSDNSDNNSSSNNK